MDKFIIQGQKKLSGEIEVRGLKNAAGPILAACLLTDKECQIDNLPLIEDISNMLEVFKLMGVEIKNISERKVKIKAEKIDVEKIDFEKISKTRMSVLLFGVLMARVKHFKISAPGGDKIGLRPINVHINALEKLGAKIEKEGSLYKVDCENLKGAEVVLEEFSVTATENIMLAAVLAEGKTIIKGAACEPHVQDLAKMLKSMGAKIEGAGTHTIEIEGVKELKGAEHSIIFDYIEAGTFIAIGAGAPGSIEVKNVNAQDIDLFLAKLEEMGVNFEKKENSVNVSYSPDLKAVRVQALPHPGFPTDLLPIIAPLLAKAEGKSLIHDPLYENRFNYVQQLRKMGADIEIVDPHRAFVYGPKELSGLAIESWDIRAGASLIVAGLMAEGKTTIENIYQIDRGYEKIEERLQKLGADIKRT
ncbi:MAG: UDP-N-acetylglucosamine 1-carboxyvinyltransferase [Candidatus Staskawiczbacteria bacterium RIFOXYC1_FULL_37_43]|nr:MAG: UDP-N-acetylglucosamine 1-carboxyvinyltransferase [Candidatus Staskawiczbacteria bacterium RIFCSPHIGHO2_01_FULL_37_17]OGZ72342.1 MAG: UDP-N-acetylglucosamine 1-carboxyvinyltransferase [Candidatus Staskawiczbacteria bacterium RIFCSPLOWO2_01_FULL_37_19]OGZ76106.1 MAG: UDP-N-acetylglucosamine 1-carboxyvinyltransferase [Candidatus Staskawiczbacteria bacterium RIFOXYA1_FULL_37_15]OGZ80073.1 MAG: UDP-N-acetylglucosamine 1-carboxyvinyltransferase [Candidatus Staskawiczbacteria bacterium RIFOXYB